MREIKFRKLFKQEDVYRWEYVGVNDRMDNLLESYLTPVSDWMQFTGLKDKNGKEIYEGDVLHSTTTINGEKLLYEVYYWPPVFNLRSLKKRDSKTINPTTKGFWSRCEVIGNIYSNPELIK